MATIELTQGQQAIVDNEDLELVSEYKWHALKTASGKFYATTQVRTEKRQKRVYLHRLITNAPAGLVVDHKDGNPLNNSRSNLRVCTTSQNLAAFRKPTKNKQGSKYRGVYYSPKGKRRWVASLRHRQETYYIGVYNTEVEAAIARDAKALELWGEYAGLNFPLEPHGDN